MNVVKINEYLSGNYEAIYTLLEKTGLTKIRVNRQREEIRCSRKEGHNPTSVKVDVNTLAYVCFSTNKHGDIYTLIMNELQISFPTCLRWVIELLDLNIDKFQGQIKLPFQGYYKSLLKSNNAADVEPPTLEENVLDDYIKQGNTRFLKDGISLETQEKYCIGYDSNTMRITVPQWNVNGDLMGIMGRLNEDKCDSGERWLPVIPCPRSQTVYGYHTNYSSIKEKQICFIFESEKSVMQLDSMGIYLGLALGTNTISDIQVNYIKALKINRIVLCLDEGILEDHIIEQAKKLQMQNTFISNKVGYIYDKQNEFLPKGGKDSPTDLGIDVFNNLIRSKIVWI